MDDHDEQDRKRDEAFEEIRRRSEAMVQAHRGYGRQHERPASADEPGPFDDAA